MNKFVENESHFPTLIVEKSSWSFKTTRQAEVELGIIKILWQQYLSIIVSNIYVVPNHLTLPPVFKDMI